MAEAVDRLEPVGVDGRIACDLPCLVCGYNLRTLVAEGVCTECGQPVGKTLDLRYLRFTSVSWLWQVSRGMRLVAWGFLVYVVGAVILPVVGAVIVELTAARLGDGMLVQGVALVSVVGAAVLLLMGVRLFTSPEPERREGRRWSARRLLRFWIWVAGAVGSVAFIGAFFEEILVAGIMGIMSWALSSFVWIVGLAYLGHLMERIPRPDLQRQARILMWALGVGSVGFVVLYGSMALVVMRAEATASAAGGVRSQAAAVHAPAGPRAANTQPAGAGSAATTQLTNVPPAVAQRQGGGGAGSSVLATPVAMFVSCSGGLCALLLAFCGVSSLVLFVRSKSAVGRVLREVESALATRESAAPAGPPQDPVDPVGSDE